MADVTQLATTAAAAYFTGGASLAGSGALGGSGGSAPPPSSSATGGKASGALNEGDWQVTFAPGIGGYGGPANLFQSGAEPFPLSVVAALGIAAALVGVLLWNRKKG